MKRVPLGRLDDAEVADALNEVRVLASVRHRNVCGFLESFVEGADARELIVVLDYCDGGDLGARVEEAKSRRRLIDEAHVTRWLGELAAGLACLHAKDVLHRDVKPANCFLDRNVVRLGDFNVSKVCRGKNALASTRIGTPYYMAPEVWADRPYSAAADVWALGCTGYELCALRPPFVGRSLAGLGKAVRAGRRDPLSRTFSIALRNDVVDACLRLDAKRRPTAAELEASPCLKSEVPDDDASRGGAGASSRGL